MHHNIVFDLGGVVIDYSPKDYLMERFFHEPTERKLYAAMFGSPEWQMLDTGQLSWHEASAIFLQRGQEMDLEMETQSVIDEWTEMLATRRATVSMMRLFRKKGYHLYYLTNMSREVLAEMSQRSFWKLFEGGIASCEVGVAKPELDIYKALLQKYSLKPQETIFTDDVKENAAAAFHVGMTGIQFKNVKNFCKTLVTYGIEI